jgi:hypothetical protein
MATLDPRLRRVIDDLEKGLQRRDPARTLEAFGKLPASSRPGFASRVAPLYRDEVRRRFTEKNFSALHRLAAQADAAPELLTIDAPPEKTAELAWTLVWASGLAKDFSRAARLMAHLQDWLSNASPTLSKAMTAWIEGQGAPPVDALPHTVPDPRLGMDPPKHAVGDFPVPKTASTAAKDAIHLYATQPWSTFAHKMSSSWLRRASFEVGEPLRREVLGLCLHEVLRRTAANEPAPHAPLSLAARCIDELRSPEAARDDTMTALRLAVYGVRAKLPSAGEHLALVLRAAVRDPGLAAMVVDLALGLEAEWIGNEPAIALFEALWKRHPTLELWLSALDRWGKDHAPFCSHKVPAWFVRAANSAIAEGKLSRLLLAENAKDRLELVAWLSALLSFDALDRFLYDLWERADGALRRTIARTMGDELSSAMGMVEAGASARDFDPAKVDACCTRWLPRGLFYDPWFFMLALELARDTRAKEAVILGFFAEGGSFEIALEALMMANDEADPILATLIGNGLLEKFHADVPVLARALRVLLATYTPEFRRSSLCRRWAEALLAAHAAHPGDRTPAERATLAQARALVGTKAKRPAKPKQAPKTKSKPKPNSKFEGATAAPELKTERSKAHTKANPEAPEAQAKANPEAPEAQAKAKPEAPKAQTNAKPAAPKAQTKAIPKANPKAQTKANAKPERPKAEPKPKPERPERVSKPKVAASPTAASKPTSPPDTKIPSKPKPPRVADQHTLPLFPDGRNGD